nr:hypothetical protein [Tanacetum cinerariifolium]
HKNFKQKGVVERRNRTLVEATRTMLSAVKVALFFWAEAIATACFTQNRSLVIPRHEKTPYHVINERKPSVKFFYIFGSLCYIVRDGENLDKMKEKGDECIFVGYSTQSRAYRVYNKRTRVIMESIHVNFDVLPHMASDHVSSDPAPECQGMALEHDSLSPGRQCKENVPQADKTVTTSNKLDLLFSLMFDELLNGSSKVVSKSSAVSTADAPNQRQHHTTPLITHKTPAPTCQVPTQVPTVTSTENMNQAKMVEEYAQDKNDEFINIFCTLVQDQGETSSRHVDSSNMHIFYHHHPSEHRWTKDHPLEQVIGNHSQSVRTRRQLESDGEMFGIPLCKNVINMNWLWKNKRNEENTVIRNKSRLVAKGYAQKEGVDFEESFAPVYFTASSMVGTLMYLTTSRPDIMHATCYYARYQAKPTDKHLTAVKRIFRYLKDTIHMGLRYPKDTDFELTAFSDSDHVGCLDSRKSTSGGLQFLGGDKLVSWSSKKQDYYGFHFDKIPMYCDSKATIAISCNPFQHSCTKHIDVRYHFIKEKVEKGIVELFFVGTEYQLADLFTKALPEERFKYLVRRLCMRCLTPDELEVLANESA